MITRIIAELAELRIKVSQIRQFFMIQRQDQIIFNHPFNHIIAGDNHIIGIGAGGKLGPHILVAGKSIVNYPNAGFRFKIVQQLLIQIIAPVKDGNSFLLGFAAAGRKQ